MSLGIGVSMRRPPHARIRLGWVLLALLVTRSSPIDIATLQTAGDAGTGTDCFPSPHSGSAVTTQGTVTSVHRDSFTMQSAAAAWSGIAIHTGLGHALLSVVRVGDALNVTATVTEIEGMTALQNLTHYEILSSGNSVGAALVTSGQLGTACNAAGEAFEGVLVSMENVEVVESGGTCDAISIHSQGSGSTQLSLGGGTLLASITGAPRPTHRPVCSCDVGRVHRASPCASSASEPTPRASPRRPPAFLRQAELCAPRKLSSARVSSPDCRCRTLLGLQLPSPPTHER